MKAGLCLGRSDGFPNHTLRTGAAGSSIANVVLYRIFLSVRSCRSLHDLARPFQPVVFSTSFREISQINSKQLFIHTGSSNFHNTTKLAVM